MADILQLIENRAREEGCQWADDLRKESLSHIKELDFPTTRDEYWKYTRLSKIIKGDFKLPDFKGNNQVQVKQGPIQLVNGIYAQHPVSINKVTVSSIYDAQWHHPEIINPYFGKIAEQKGQIFTNINTAGFSKGLFIHVPQNTCLESPLVIDIYADSEELFIQPRIFIFLEDNAQIQVVFNWKNNQTKGSFTNAVIEGALNKNATLELVQIQNDTVSEKHIQTAHFKQHSGSVLNHHIYTFSGELVRNNLNIDLEGEHTETHFYGLFLTRDKQHVDNHTVINHKEPNCNSNEIYKGVLSGSSTGVFNGKVNVFQKAQKTNAFQSNKNILLSDLASVYSKPELEIYADDVKCSHGSTTGQLDEEALFYLRSRGIGKPEAIRLLVKAFAEDLTGNIQNEKTRKSVESLIENHFEELHV